MLRFALALSRSCRPLGFLATVLVSTLSATAAAGQESVESPSSASAVRLEAPRPYDSIGRDRGGPLGSREELLKGLEAPVPSTRRPTLAAGRASQGRAPAPPTPAANHPAWPRPVHAPPPFEDADEIRRLQQEQERFSSRERLRAAAQWAALPGEPKRSGKALRTSWASIGSGIEGRPVPAHPTSTFHRAGRIRGAQYVFDDELGYTTIYAASPGGGLFRLVSLLIVTVWEPMSDSFPANPVVGGFLVDRTDSSRILIGTGDVSRGVGTGMYRSIDGGDTWERTPLDPSPTFFYRIAQDLGDPEVVVAASSSGIWRSENFGDSWNQVYSERVTDVVQDPVFWQFWLAGAPGIGVLESSTSATEFHPIDGNGGSGLGGAATGRITYAISRSDASYHYLIAADSAEAGLYGIFRSTNFGYDWTRIDPGDTISGGQAFHTGAIAVDPLDRGRVFAGMAFALWTDNADAADPATVCWRANDAPSCGSIWQGGHADYLSFTFVPQAIAPGNTRVLITNDGGVYVYDWNTNVVDGDANLLGLTAAQQWPTHENTLAAARLDPGYALAGTFDNGIVRIDRDGPGSRLKDLGGGDGGRVSISPDDTSHLFVSVGVGWVRSLALSGEASFMPVDCGLAVSPPSTPRTLIDPTPGFGMAIYTHTARDLWAKPLSLNCDWAKVNSTPLGSASYDMRHFDQANNPSELIFYVTGWYQNALYVLRGTTLGALAPVLRTPPVVGSPLAAAAFADRSTLQPQTVYYTSAAGRPSQAWLSTNAGGTWRNVTGNLATLLPDASYWELVGNPSNLDQLFLATSVGVLRSDDGGSTWYRYQNGLPEVADVLAIELSYDDLAEPELMIGTFGRGWWRRVIDTAPLEAPMIFSNGFENGVTVAVKRGIPNPR